jgi:hypothetical protein
MLPFRWVFPGAASRIRAYRRCEHAADEPHWAGAWVIIDEQDNNTSQHAAHDFFPWVQWF